MRREKKMSFLEHLDELRRRLINSLVAIAIAFLISWFFHKEIYHFLALPVLQFLPPGEDQLAYTSLTEPFFFYLKISFLAALFLASPVVVTELWRFISPALYRRERRYALPFVISGSLFFIAGGAFGYYIAFPMVCRFFLAQGMEFRQVVTVKSYLSLLTTILLGLGLVFETPILIFFLSRLGLVSPGFLLRNFKYAVLIIFIIAAIITPTPDVVTQTTFALPMIGLYALGIFIAKVFGRKDEGEDEKTSSGEEGEEERDEEEDDEDETSPAG
jgi:sec-independent protein translocase protein TatC